MTRETSSLLLSTGARECHAVLLKLKGKTLAKQMKFAVYFEVTTKNESGRYWCYQHTISPSRLSRVSLQSISHIIPQYRLNLPLLSNSCISKNGVRHCLPLMYPNRIACWKRPAPAPHLVFLPVNNCHLVKLSVFVRHLFGLSSQQRS